MILGLEWSQIFDVVSLRKMHFALELHTFPVLIEQVPNLMKDYDLSLIQFQRLGSQINALIWLCILYCLFIRFFPTDRPSS